MENPSACFLKLGEVCRGQLLPVPTRGRRPLPHPQPWIWGSMWAAPICSGCGGRVGGAGAAGERLIRSSGPAQAQPHRLAHFFTAASDCCKGPVPPWSYWQWLMTESPRSPSPGAGCLPLRFDSPCLSGKSAVQQLL